MGREDGEQAQEGGEDGGAGRGAGQLDRGYLSEDVLAESEEWPVKLQANLQRIIERIESRGLPSLTAEHAKHIRGKIWELRPDAEGVEGGPSTSPITGKRVVKVLCKI